MAKQTVVIHALYRDYNMATWSCDSLVTAREFVQRTLNEHPEIVLCDIVQYGLKSNEEILVG